MHSSPVQSDAISPERIPEGRFTFETRETLCAAAETTSQWFVDRLIPVDGTTIFFGVPGDGKSTVCLALAMAIENGLPFGDQEEFIGSFPGEKVPTAWITFEDGGIGEIGSRLRTYDPDLQSPLVLDGTLTPELVAGTLKSQEALAAETRIAWNELGQTLHQAEVKVAFIDTLSDWASTDASPHLVQACLQLLSHLRRHFAITAVLIGHASSHAREYRKSQELMGATAWMAKARHAVLVESNRSQTWMRVTKSNRGQVGFNVTMSRVDGGPINITSATSPDEYAAERQKSTQKRSWERRREQAQLARTAGPKAWTSVEALGEAAGGSKTIGKNLVKAGFFRKVGRGTYEPVNELIDGDWQAWEASQ